MRRLAIFVEGRTELLFVDRLIREIAESRKIAIQHNKIRGGGRDGKTPKSIIVLQTPSVTSDNALYVLIVDCGGEQLVAQRVREEHAYLTNKGYELVVGLRDVYPKFTQQDVPKLRHYLKYGIKTSLAPVEFLLAVMEIEAWFLAEYNHFPLIDPAITVDSIRSVLGFDPVNDHPSDRLSPASDMVAAYAIGGKAYVKGDAASTITLLDYAHVYEVLRNKIPDLSRLLDIIDRFVP